MKMNLQEKFASMDKIIWDMVAMTLSNIRADSSDHDFVVDDKDDNFKTLFLNSAYSKLHTAYNAYVIQAELDNRNQVISKLNKKIVNGSQGSQSTLTDDFDVESVGSVMNSLNPFKDTPSDNQYQRPDFAQPFDDVSEDRKCAELQLQNRFRSTVTVQGLPTGRGDGKSVESLFQILCRYIGEPVDEKEITNIYVDGYYVTVTLNDESKCHRLLARFRRTINLKSDDVFTLLPGEIPSPIKILSKYTLYYKGLTQLATRYTRQGQINHYIVYSAGLGIHVNADSAPIYVRSKNELIQQVRQIELKKKDSPRTIKNN